MTRAHANIAIRLPGSAVRAGMLAAVLLLSGCRWMHLFGSASGEMALNGHAKTVAEVIAELPPAPGADVAPPSESVASRPGNADSTPTAATKPIAEAVVSLDGANGAAVPVSSRVHVTRETLDQVVARYEDVLPSLTDQDTRMLVRKRVADLKLERQSLNLDRADYAQVIAEYQGLLTAPASPQVHDALAVSIRYQMARARDLAGQSDQAVTDLDALIKNSKEVPSRGEQRVFIQEAMFRRAESAFSRGDYAAAASDYEVAAAADSPYRLHASYMLGWAQFKTHTTAAALDAFFTVIEQLNTGGRAEQLSGSERELLADTLRATVLCFERGDGTQVLAAAMRDRQHPAWQNVVYVALGKFYLDHQRYQDAAHTFAKFEDENSLHADAPAFALRAIDALAVGGFPNEAEALQPKFVERYSRGTPFYAALGDAGVAPLRDRLHEFIDRLAGSEHALAQQHNDRAHYVQAAHWYRAWLTNFDVATVVAEPTATIANSADAKATTTGERATDGSAAADSTVVAAAAIQSNAIGERLYLLGDVLVASGQPAEAVPVYRDLVTRFPQHARAHEAGYAVVLALSELTKADAKQAPLLLAAELDFADRFADDARAPDVALNAARALLDTTDNSGAATTAEHALTRWQLPPARAAVAREIAAEARFALGDLADAEQHFVAARDLAPNAVERQRWQTRLIATVGKQAELAQTAGDVPAAIGHLRRMAQIEPNSKTAVTGLLNVAALLVQTKDLAAAAAELEKIRRAHPADPLVADIPLKLADLYERLQQPVAAADELGRVALLAKDAEQARNARYHAAELYLAGKATQQARTALQDYVQKYPRPVTAAAEAVKQLRELADAARDGAALNAWTVRQIELHDRAGKDGNDRTRFLAAEASFALAEQLRAGFEGIALRQPLGVTLKNKRAALDKSVAGYERAGAYRVQQFLTGATLKIAGMYERLASDVRGSERPKGLTPAGLEQYEASLNGRAQSFVERAIELHRLNAARAKDGIWDESVAASFAALASIAPASYARPEVGYALVTHLE